jgi:hypothetical protein
MLPAYGIYHLTLYGLRKFLACQARGQQQKKHEKQTTQHNPCNLHMNRHSPDHKDKSFHIRERFRLI